MPAIKGTASVADSRARQKALKKTKFPRSFRTSVDVEKINRPVLTQWIEQKVTSILGFEDEIVSSTVINLFLPSDNASPDPKKAQLDLAGFLGEESASFSAELWKLMIEAQNSNSGIPQTLLEQKKKEMSERMVGNAGAHQENQTGRVKNRFSQSNQRAGTDRTMNDRVKNDLPSELHIPSNRTHATLPGQGVSKRYDNKKSKNTNDREHPPQPKNHNLKDLRKGSSKDVAESSTDQFGRVLPSQRSRNLQRGTSRDQHDRNRRGQYRSRSRSRERYDHGRERGSVHRRRIDDRHRQIDGHTRRLDDRWHDSNQDDSRRDYHQYSRHNQRYDRDRYYDRDDRRDPYRRYEREIDSLRRRLAQLKEKRSEHDKKNHYRNIDEMKDIEDRIYELERHRRRRSFSREDYGHSRSRRGRSPSYEYRQGGRRKRDHSNSSDRSNSESSSRDDYSTDSSGSRSRYSRSPDRSKTNKGNVSQKRRRRRRLRSFSSSKGSEQYSP